MQIDPMLGIAQLVANGDIGKDYVYCMDEETFYHYEDNYWKRLHGLELESEILQKYNSVMSYTVTRRRQILDNLRLLIYRKLEEFNKTGFLNFPEGEMDMETGYIHEHKKENYSTLRMPYHFRFGADCPLWKKTLDEIFEGNKEKSEVLQEFFGYCLTRDTKQRKALLLIGECLGGETLIFDPIKNKSIPVSEIKDDFHVEAWDGNKVVIARALKPFKKEVDDLYTVTLSNGKNFVCSKSHKILTSFGYLPLSELHEGCEVFLPSTTSGISPFPYKPPSLVITSIVYKRTDYKWDFTVPIYHNYICSGAVHHNSNCGKSTILWTLRNLLGEKNCSAVSIQNINNPQYTANLMNKLVNIDTDVSQDARSYEEQFKKIAGGEAVGCNPKYIAPFEFLPYARIVMGSNGFPRVTDHSEAFFNRLIMIPCERVFNEEEQNKDLPELLKGELSGIFNWAWEGLQRLNNRGRFEIRDFMKQAKQDLRDESNPIDVFFRDTVEIDKSGNEFIVKGDLYNKYIDWCKNNGNAPMSNIKFGKSVLQKYHKYTDKNSQDFATGHRIWRNLKYKQNGTLPKENIAWTD